MFERFITHSFVLFFSIGFFFIPISNIQHYVSFVLNIFHHAQIPMFMKKLSSTKGWTRIEWQERKTQQLKRPQTQSNRINDSLDPKIKACNHYLSVTRVSCLTYNENLVQSQRPETGYVTIFMFIVIANTFWQ